MRIFSPVQKLQVRRDGLPPLPPRQTLHYLTAPVTWTLTDDQAEDEIEIKPVTPTIITFKKTIFTPTGDISIPIQAFTDIDGTNLAVTITKKLGAAESSIIIWIHIPLVEIITTTDPHTDQAISAVWIETGVDAGTHTYVPQHIAGSDPMTGWGTNVALRIRRGAVTSPVIATETVGAQGQFTGAIIRGGRPIILMAMEAIE